jgi:hypothetical protein
MQNNFVVAQDYPNNKVKSLFFSDRICPGHDYTSKQQLDKSLVESTLS